MAKLLARSTGSTKMASGSAAIPDGVRTVSAFATALDAGTVQVTISAVDADGNAYQLGQGLAAGQSQVHVGPSTDNTKSLPDTVIVSISGTSTNFQWSLYGNT